MWKRWRYDVVRLYHGSFALLTGLAWALEECHIENTARGGGA